MFGIIFTLSNISLAYILARFNNNSTVSSPDLLSLHIAFRLQSYHGTANLVRTLRHTF